MPKAAVGAPETDEYPTLPLSCTRLLPRKDVATANAVPISVVPDAEESPWSPADTFTIPWVSENSEAAAVFCG